MDSAALSWRLTIPSLSPMFRVIALDLPGFGRSDRLDLDYSSRFYIHFVSRFVEKMALGPLSVVGLSMGGLISLGFALRHPLQVSSLVLVDSAGLGRRIPLARVACLAARMPRLYQACRKLTAARRGALAAALGIMVHRPRVLTEGLLDEVWRAFRLSGEGRAWVSFLRSEIDWQGFRTCFLDQVDQIRAPTLLVHGSHDRLIPLAHSQKAHRLIRGSRLCILQDCGHWAPREKPAEFNQILLGFLAR